MVRRSPHRLRSLAAPLGVATLVAALLSSACFGPRTRGPLYGYARYAPVAPAPQPSAVAFQNDSSEAIVDVRMSPSDQRQWGGNLLAGRTLQVGQTFTVHGVTAGMWDLRVADQSGNTKEWRTQRVQGGGTYLVAVTPVGWAH